MNVYRRAFQDVGCESAVLAANGLLNVFRHASGRYIEAGRGQFEVEHECRADYLEEASIRCDEDHWQA